MDHGSSTVPVTTKKQNLRFSSRPAAISKQDMPCSFFHCNFTGKCWICSFVSETCDSFWKLNELNELNGLVACLKFCSGISTFNTLVTHHASYKPLTSDVRSFFLYLCLLLFGQSSNPFKAVRPKIQTAANPGDFRQKMGSVASQHSCGAHQRLNKVERHVASLNKKPTKTFQVFMFSSVHLSNFCKMHHLCHFCVIFDLIHES